MKKALFVGMSVAALLAMSNTALASVNPGGGDGNPLPTTVNECKKGGWENYGGLFKNQGDCVSYVVTEGRNAPNGPAAQ